MKLGYRPPPGSVPWHEAATRPSWDDPWGANSFKREIQSFPQQGHTKPSHEIGDSGASSKNDRGRKSSVEQVILKMCKSRRRKRRGI